MDEVLSDMDEQILNTELNVFQVHIGRKKSQSLGTVAIQRFNQVIFGI